MIQIFNADILDINSAETTQKKKRIIDSDIQSSGAAQRE
jgi:hypothetical protein